MGGHGPGRTPKPAWLPNSYEYLHTFRWRTIAWRGIMAFGAMYIFSSLTSLSSVDLGGRPSSEANQPDPHWKPYYLLQKYYMSNAADTDPRNVIVDRRNVYNGKPLIASDYLLSSCFHGKLASPELLQASKAANNILVHARDEFWESHDAKLKKKQQ
eukprot:TRINITY_DN7613_c0_g1_i1.p1 TRINITY_DN7613_c0_g1~~TRINITY_DN7613_c0_g1_i1.p1  ORF type:complete len:157 (+),score=12.71 TRINITY_DN7613_c0_g1_i1:127-597(+)